MRGKYEYSCYNLHYAFHPNANELDDIVRSIRTEAMSSGFFYVKNHSIDLALVQRQFELAKELFDLSHSVKKKYHQNNSPSHRGFEEIAAQKLDFTAKVDIKEGFYWGKNYAPDHRYPAHPKDAAPNTFGAGVHTD